MTRLILAVVAAVVSSAILGISAFALASTFDLSGCTGMLGRGWVIPLLAVLVIGGIVWVLAGQLPKTRKSDERRATSAEAIGGPVCTSCGSAVMESWRVCPGCGRLLED